jgi:hypothetical protein
MANGGLPNVYKLYFLFFHLYSFSLHLSRIHKVVYSEKLHGFDEKTVEVTKRRYAGDIY